MPMKYFKFLMLFIIAGALQGCPGEDDGLILINDLTLINECGETIYYDCYEVSEREIKSSDLYFERLIRVQDMTNSFACKYYEQQFKTAETRVWILVYKQSTLDNYSWEEIQEQNIFDARYSFTLEELQAMNWEVVYTGE